VDSKWPDIEDNAGIVDNLSPRARLLLWDYTRGSLPYDLLCLLLLLLMLLVPPIWLGDPMVPRP
jgi:hypothetical protein